MEERLDAFVRKAGSDLDKAFAETGTPLPPGTSGEEMIRGFLEESRREAASPAGQARQQALSQIGQEVAAGLPKGSADPAFPQLLWQRYKAWLDEHQPEGT